MIPGLGDELLEKLQDLFAARPKIQSVRIFGSRASGQNRPDSDIDLAVSGDLDQTEISRLRLDLEELPTLCSFDLVHIDTLSNASLRQRIDQTGLIIYRRDNRR